MKDAGSAGILGVEEELKGEAGAGKSERSHRMLLRARADASHPGKSDLIVGEKLKARLNG